jgi:asparagine synthase (glutamine-hydrolysing)
MAMPSAMKIRDGVGKQPLKRAVADLLPHDLIWRPKQGFGTPVAQWFRGELGDQLAVTLRESALHDTGYLDRSALEQLLEEHRSGRAERSLQLWNLLNLSMWFDHWIALESVAA